MNFKPIMLAGIAMVTALSVSAQDQENPKYMRSSVYTVLVKSDRQNKELDKEVEETNIITAVTDAFVDAKKAKNDTTGKAKSEMPQEAFLSIAIPDQFNDHNLNGRIIDFDAISAGIPYEEAKKYNESVGLKKKSGFGKFAKGLGGAALGALTGQEQSNIIKVDTVDEYIPAVVNAYINENKVAANMLAKWFNYDASQTPKWNEGLVVDRGLYNASAVEKAKAENSDFLKAELAGKGFELLNNTYLIAINLKYRSNKAIMAEAQQLANAAGSLFGDIGVIAAQGAGAVTGMAVGDGYSVQAVTYLYKLDWNDSISTCFAEQIYDKNATIEDLIKSGICKLTYYGKEKASANVRQSKFSSKPETELVKRATERAIDEAICKLQEKFEVFRTTFPISKVDENGNVYAKVGMKEGIKKDDEYQILEMIEGENGKIEYKEIKKVKAVDKQIWDNRAGIADEMAENEEFAKDDKDAQKTAEAASLGYTMFKGGKKNVDYTGYFLRLKKKK